MRRTVQTKGSSRRSCGQALVLSTGPSAVDNRYMDMPDRDNVFDSLSKGIERLSTVAAQAVAQPESWVSFVRRQAQRSCPVSK